MTRRQVHRFASFVTTISALVLTAALWAGLAHADTGSASSGSGSGSASGSASGLFSGSASGSAQLPVASPRAMAALTLATTQTGKPYRWGGTGPNDWDCSGLVQWAFRSVGIDMPRTTWQQAAAGLEVPAGAMQVGDVVVLNNDASHVGIYAGGGKVLNAYDWGVPVGLTPLSQFDIYTIRRFY
ncbi:NlpC/P60 family protein [Nocardia sp. NPDC046763]|uniref:C40 family peptidase n=1 Tax=Nocardia sp. NPDC046763 TaxID=3155256 RepID=UPI003405AE2F